MNATPEHKTDLESPARNGGRRGPRILLSGATGYIGGRLLRALEAGGNKVRCLARRPERLRGQVVAALGDEG
jgi:nucleoside-diphosphate-sugar epimerase